jgi:hypothetical protein
MLQQKPPTNMEQWADSMHKQMIAQQEQLRTRLPEQVAHDSGSIWEPAEIGAGTLSLKFLNMPLRVSVPEFAVENESGNEVPTMIQALVTAYLLTADGTARAGKWIAFRELPGGLFYHQAFLGYTGGLLVRSLGDDLDTFKRGAKAMGGTVLTGFGDAAHEFRVLPRLWLCVVYWLGDEEDGFPPQANLLFDRSASHYLIVDGLAIVGSHLTRHIISAAQSATTQGEK